MSLASKDDLRSMAQRLVPRIAPKDVPVSEAQRVGKVGLQETARRMLKELEK